MRFLAKKADAASCQCEGGFPCTSCVRTCRRCTPPKPKKSMIVLKDVVPSNSITSLEPGYLATNPNLTRPLQADLVSLYIGHFFSSFLPSNNFSGKIFDDIFDVRFLLQSSSSLRNALIAVAATDVRRQSLGPAKPAEGIALHFYRAAISSVRSELLNRNVIANDSVLWSTFFLGMFEVSPSTSSKAARTTLLILLICRAVNVRRLR